MRLAALLIAAVALVGGLLAVNRTQQNHQRREATNSTPTHVATPKSQVDPPAVPDPPTAASIDRGSLNPRQISAAVKVCLHQLNRSTTIDTIHLARGTTTHKVVIFTGGDHISYVCAGANDSKIYDGPNPPLPGADSHREPVERLYGISTTTDVDLNGRATTRTTAAYRATPGVASIQLRLVQGTTKGPWYPAALHNGYAFGEVHLSYEADSAHTSWPAGVDLEVEDRALDSAGQPLAILRVRS